jgi:hypothetical protein
MARQQYSTTPYIKHLEVFNDFSRGLNTVTTNDRLTPNELPVLTNMDLGSRGSLTRRAGMVKYKVPPIQGPAQGYFRFYTGATYQEIIATNGRFSVDGEVKPITNLATFQTERPIEGVQFGEKMYFATGTDLVVYDGTTFSVVVPHKPQPLEALYIGTNGLSDDPDNFMADSEGTFLRLDGTTFSSRYGVVNQAVTLAAHVTKPVEGIVEYQFEWRTPFMPDGFWELGRDWSTVPTWAFVPNVEGDVQFRINGRMQGGTVAEVQYLVPKYKVKATTDPNDVAVDTQYLKRCNRILLHWGRLVLYGDEQNPDTVYFSHLNQPNYFPVPNSLRFLNPRREGITALVPFRDMVVVFTPTSIQALYGKSPSDFKRVMLNTSIGCIAPYSPAVVKNYIAFLSQDGVHYLKSLGYVEDKANVEKVDRNVDNIVPRSEDVCGIVHDGQYHLVFPSEGKRLRMYTDTGAWTKDESSKLDFQRMFVFGSELYGQSKVSGDILGFSKGSDTDDGEVFTDVFETRNLDFGQPYHRKKLKELQVLVSPKDENISANVYVYADSALVLSPDESHAEIVDDSVVWVAQFNPNLVTHTGAVMGEWKMSENPFGEVDTVVDKLRISGNCLRTRIRIENGRHVLGFAYIFKLKKN